MRRILVSGWASALLVVLVWRGASELLDQRRRLVASGELDRRIAARRDLRLSRAPARVAVPASDAGPRVDRAVRVGSVGLDDFDDVGLLDASMRRAARERMEVDGGRLRRAASGRVDWVQVLADDVPVPGVGTAAWWAVLLAACAASLTFAPLVRPLGEAAPWIALTGVALASVAWLAGRRS